MHKQWQPLEEALGVALLRLEERLAGHAVTTELRPDLPLVPIDELLIEQVFINLLENAAKYTPRGTPIRVSAWAERRCRNGRGCSTVGQGYHRVTRRAYSGSSIERRGRMMPAPRAVPAWA